MWYLALAVAVQIIVESLPVSSSGHVVLIERMVRAMPVSDSFVGQGYLALTINQVIENCMRLAHGVTVVILALFFARHIILFVTDYRLRRLFLCKIVPFVVLADMVTAFWYLIIKIYGAFSLPLSWGFVITAVVLYSLKWCIARREPFWSDLSLALILGTVQGIALLPGISRFAAIFTAARWCGIRSERSFEIAWLIHVPLMMAVAALGAYRLMSLHIGDVLFSPALGVTVIVASVLGYVALSYAWRHVQRGTFWQFSRYMIVPLILSLFFQQ